MNRPFTAETAASNLRKAAIFLISLGAKSSAQILKHLADDEIERLSAEIARITSLKPTELENVQGEFQQMVLAQQYIATGGFNYAQEILKEAMGDVKALEISHRVKSALQIRGFNILKNVDTNQLLAFLQKEHPQTIALVLTQLTSMQAANILTELPPAVQVNVVHRIARMERVSPETLSAVEKVLETRIDFSQGASAFGGVKTAAEMLNMVGTRFEKNILNGIARENPNLAVEIKNLMFVFEDLITLDDRSIQRILKEVDNKDLAMALKACSEELKKKILSNMSKRASEMIIEELEYMGPVRLKEVEEVQQKIIDIVRRLEEDEEITIASHSLDDQLV
ncbi:MAG: flagellar motor switch protein FliG [Calditrichaeota bacterium]|nr:flagellar motor switch protein FliG [Calditrichota bacterium]